MSETGDNRVGKPPRQIDQEQPTEDQVLQHMEKERTASSDTLTDGDVQPSGGDLPTRHEMWDIIQEQQEAINTLQDEVVTLQEQLEQSDGALQEATNQLEDAARQLREGKISGEAGVELLSQLNNYNPSTKTEGRAVRLYYRIIEEGKVDAKIKTSLVVRWLSINTANPNQTAHRAMDCLDSLTDDGVLVGDVTYHLWRGERVVQMVGDSDE